MEQHFKKTVLSIISFFLISSNIAFAKEYVVDQKDKIFSTKKLTIKVGDTVTFTNSDPLVHNIHSLTDTDDFDLGLAVKGAEVSRVFYTPGFIKIECAIHPSMNMIIDVKK